MSSSRLTTDCVESDSVRSRPSSHCLMVSGWCLLWVGFGSFCPTATPHFPSPPPELAYLLGKALRPTLMDVGRCPASAAPQNMSPRRHLLPSALVLSVCWLTANFLPCRHPHPRSLLLARQQSVSLARRGPMLNPALRPLPHQARFSLSESLKTKFGGLPAANPCRSHHFPPAVYPGPSLLFSGRSGTQGELWFPLSCFR